MTTHIELLQQLGLINIAEPMAREAYELRERKVWEGDLNSSPHGQPWHTSFHASRFPGDPDRPCARQALYGLLNVPAAEPTSQYLVAIGDAGKAIEDEYVQRWEEAGMLISRPPSSKYQSGFADPRYWLTGNLDAALRPRGWNRCHVTDVKSKDHNVIDAMKRGDKSYEPAHYYQVQVYLGFLQTQYMTLYKDWAERKITMNGILRMIPSEQQKEDYCIEHGLVAPPTSGSLLYVSRDRPRHTHEFVFDFAPEVWTRGVELLDAWKKCFINRELPPRDKTWKWLEQPCQYCAVKRLCKADDKAGITDLSKSVAVKFSKALRPAYDFETTRKQVLDRWRDKDDDIPDN